MLEKTYRPQEVEAKWYATWEEAGAFRPDFSRGGEPFCLMMPPPNVTGSLHLGHALDHTLQDLIVRFQRMRGRPTLWQPGTDHAGIATQMMVERKLASEGTSRKAIGREAFLEECWKWKEASEGNILGQLRRLGDSADWSRLRFTMEPDLYWAVTHAFVELHKQGLIYKDKRLVNWDCQLETAVSDLESVPTEVNGKLWHFSYPIEGVAGASITVATTRPETMLGDTAVAVHPDDERYHHLQGKMAILPLVGRKLRIVADTYSDPEKGTGAVKITPAHDFNDFEVGRRHGLAMINIFDTRGQLNEEVPETYRGLDRFEARQRIVNDMEAQGLLLKVESIVHNVPYGDRSNTPIEPYLTDQWYCRADILAEAAIEAIESGQTRFVPKSAENTYFQWMRNIQPWCISRQLWWGHRIPAWYGPDGEIFVAESEEAAQAAAEAHYGKPTPIDRDPDVLDTWFSSGLWPFSTLGWPEETDALKTFYPTSVLVTGFDIIFFWVARMMMQGLQLKHEIPFKDIVMHGLVRDEQGQKMSKTRGNVVDPLAMIDRYGADALRYTILASTALGRDVKFSPQRVEGYRNFMTKLWNAARFLEMNEARLDPAFAPNQLELPLNRWITGGLIEVSALVSSALEDYRVNDAALGLYHFVWNTYCDWYIELAKPTLQGGDGAPKEETRRTSAWVLGQILHLLHPLAPFISEELWADLTKQQGGLLITADWPSLDAGLIDETAKNELDWLVRVVSGIRAARSELTVPASAMLDLKVHGAGPESAARLERNRDVIMTLARLRHIELAEGDMPKRALQVVVDEATLVLPIEGVIDLDAERKRLEKEISKTASEIDKISKKLGNANFLEKAPEDVVEIQRQRQAEASQAQDRLQAALERLI